MPIYWKIGPLSLSLTLSLTHSHRDSSIGRFYCIQKWVSGLKAVVMFLLSFFSVSLFNITKQMEKINVIYTKEGGFWTNLILFTIPLFVPLLSESLLAKEMAALISFIPNLDGNQETAI